ncbi:hypothetical protein HDU93_003817 [Gonapodya sp. JEL0774]|nr:hypothetical protein HDU93_003817 [Gonapodya sp. JEL0774]
MAGFAILVEKEWVAAGHKFSSRSGHLSKEMAPGKEDKVLDGPSFRQQIGQAAKTAQGFLKAAASGGLNSDGRAPSPSEPPATTATLNQGNRNTFQSREVSPVFLQFLDCTYQIWRQFPSRFEFGEQYLAELAAATYSCQFGNFLFNSEQERLHFRTRREGKTLDLATESIWRHFQRNRERLLNPIYVTPGHPNSVLMTPVDPASPGPRVADDDADVLLPDPSDVQYWRTMLFRSDGVLKGMEQSVSAAGPSTTFGEDAVDDGDGSMRELTASGYTSGSLLGSTSVISSDRDDDRSSAGVPNGGPWHGLRGSSPGLMGSNTTTTTTFKPAPPTFDGWSGDGADGDGWGSTLTATSGGATSLLETVLSRAAAGLESVAAASDIALSKAAAGLEAAFGGTGAAIPSSSVKPADPLGGMDFNPWTNEDVSDGSPRNASASVLDSRPHTNEFTAMSFGHHTPFRTPTTNGTAGTPASLSSPTFTPPSPPLERKSLPIFPPADTPYIAVQQNSVVPTTTPATPPPVVNVVEERKKPEGWHPLMDL